ncbi:transcriptional regulator [Sphingomonas sp. ABOLD]|uniref:ogr/Delta-like zinc finger family protein n=1 Tax=Sphingomonas TaxID=13687 RepID=UPI000F7EE7BA|nr:MULTISPECIES: ogr/Delta-like zinc finger family protein [Sphingomonas]RSV34372.1 transcriptional regulator [Sphingomonas sp. ABOLE]RSV50595.1 transcriptional regulator [Sphingomonas sp. ABOLD]
MTSRRRFFRCPECGAGVTCRTSEQVTPTVREARLLCDSDDCGCAFVVQIVAVRLVVRGMKPNPAVHLPVGRWREPANDDAPRPPANDDEAPPEVADTVGT